jgi:C1A family cysteine protease
MSYLSLSPAGRRYGLYWQSLSHPARMLTALRVAPETPLPAKAATSQWKGPTRDQGQEGSCTGQMGAAMRDLLYRKMFLFEKDKSVAAAGFKASASFVYKCNLIADGVLGTDAGSSIYQTVVSLNEKGAALESEEPYSDTDFSVAPTAEQYTEGLIYKGGSHHFLPDLISMKACIASQYSFGFGIQVYDSFESAWPVPGFMPMPDTKTEKLLGGHAQHVLDYDDTIEFPDGSVGGFLVQNSWGSPDVWTSGIDAPGHTDGGCYWMPYKFINAGLANDAQIIHLGGPW